MTSPAIKTDQLVRPRHVVAAVLVAHDGARWLPTTLHAVKTQSRPAGRLWVFTACKVVGSHLAPSWATSTAATTWRGRTSWSVLIAGEVIYGIAQTSCSQRHGARPGEDRRRRIGLRRCALLP